MKCQKYLKSDKFSAYISVYAKITFSHLTTKMFSVWFFADASNHFQWYNSKIIKSHWRLRKKSLKRWSKKGIQAVTPLSSKDEPNIAYKFSFHMAKASKKIWCQYRSYPCLFICSNKCFKISIRHNTHNWNSRTIET